MTRIYTKGGDTGETGLIGGVRVPKDHLRVAAYGDVDELNAVLGVAIAHSHDAASSALLREIQPHLFALGAHLADPRDEIAATKPKAALTIDHVSRLERAIDAAEAGMPALTTFLLPGGSPCAAHMHVARAVCRRAERAVVTLSRSTPVDPTIVVFLNRLSDLLFVLARAENRRAGVGETAW